jgi:tRNA A-37 threonylcarbamoyl transferase component Bud32/tetratricopeptide (TPR) repeat protein
MDSARYQRLKSLMIEALDRPDQERERFIDEACGDDADLRADLLRLIGHSISDGFLADSALAMDERQQAESLIGATIGRIRIDRLIARGGMGEVYAGEDQLLERPVAIKLIRSQWRWSEARRDAFLAEARALSALAHPNICQVHDFFSDDERDVLVMELIDGRTLREVLAQDGQPGHRQALTWAAQIADALVSAHEQGIAHRDLKPDNVMLTAGDQVKVLDFGLARSLPVGDQAGVSTIETQAGGTPGYLAPEQARGNRATPASDIWSFGVLLIELLTGKAAFDEHQTGSSLLEQAKRGEILLPTGQPRAEARLLRSLLSPEPGLRPSARELRAQLQRIIDRPKRRLTVTAISALLVVLALGGFRYTVDLQNERDRAEAARTEAENLAQFMLQDLYTGLDSVGRLDLLEPVADQSIDYFINRRGATSSDAPNDLGTGLALMRSAQVMFYQGRLSDSIEVMEEALRRLRALNAERPDDRIVQFHLIEGLNDLSSQLNSGGFHPRSQAAAREALHRAQATLDALNERNDTSEDERIRTWDLLLQAWYALSDSALRGGDFQLSIDSAQRALTLIESRAPDLRLMDQRFADIAWTRCLATLQLTRSRGQVEACQTPLDIDATHFEANPEGATAKLNYTNSLWLMSQAQRIEGDPSVALEYAKEAERLARELIAWDPEQPRHSNTLAVVLISQARALAMLQRENDRLQALNQALSLTSTMVGDGEDHLVVHNHATILALLGQAEEARPWAKMLMDSGWNRPGFIQLCHSLSLDPRCGDIES